MMAFPGTYQQRRNTMNTRTNEGGFMRYTAILLILVLSLTSVCFATEPVKPSGRDKCPVCGMFVAKYPDFLAEIVFKDGSYATFDGPKDMFKYYLNLPKYNGSQKQEDVKAVYVTDYYALKWIDGFKVVYVVGSDVMGPMGRELIPFGKQEDADEFMADHNGKTRLLFNEVTLDLLKSLD
jgi:nitrous oxide reductase accessory protein NosL